MAPPDPITAEEFERGYAERSGVTIEWLHTHGRYAEPCDCGDDGCEGWQMGHTVRDRGC
jgi:hypothetical protein